MRGGRGETKRTMTMLVSLPRKRHRLFALSGLTDRKLASIGAVAILAAHTEQYTERAIWALEGGPKKGERPWTDSKPISALIARLEKHSESVTTDAFARFIREWCAAARPTFDCRNSIMHGEADLPSDDWSLFTRNVSSHGVRRSRPKAEFHASDHTLALLEEAFEDCFEGIFILWKTAGGRRPPSHFEKFSRALSRAGSTASELTNLAAAYNNEKY
jgi:hypothetical protein